MSKEYPDEEFVLRGTRDEMVRELLEMSPGMSDGTAARIVDDHIASGETEIHLVRRWMGNVPPGMNPKDYVDLVADVQEAMTGHEVYRDQG